MFAEAPERDEVQVRRVKHKFDANEDEDGVTPGERTGHTDGEQERGQDQITRERTHFFPSCCMAMMTAPRSAAVNSRPITSSGNTYLVMSASPICLTVI